MTDTNKQTELEETSALLEQMTPEDLMNMMRRLEQADESLPEAPSSANFRAHSKTGISIMFTLRDWHESNLIVRLSGFIKALEHYGFAPDTGDRKNVPVRTPVTQEPSPADLQITSENVAPESLQGAEMFEVSEIITGYTTAGKPYLLCKGGPWTKYGWRAYPETVPSAFNPDEFVGGTTNIPPQLQYAYFKKEAKKILAFAMNPS